ncbi:exocyst complex component 1-like [Aplochiton taeniatus]
MSSLLKEEMQKVLFRPKGEKMKDFIEIVEPSDGRHFLCVSVSKKKEVHVCIVNSLKAQASVQKKKSLKPQCQRSGLEDSYKRTEAWLLKDMKLLDGREADADDPCFLMHFDKVRLITAISCSAKYCMARTLLNLSDKHCQRSLTMRNFDWAYIKTTALYANRGDCVVLMQICFYAANLVCLSLCPVPLD